MAVPIPCQGLHIGGQHEKARGHQHQDRLQPPAPSWCHQAQHQLGEEGGPHSAGGAVKGQAVCPGPHEEG
eukprot:457805-Prorocentrum_lima.AAC.1